MKCQGRGMYPSGSGGWGRGNAWPSGELTDPFTVLHMALSCCSGTAGACWVLGGPNTALLLQSRLRLAQADTCRHCR